MLPTFAYLYAAGHLCDVSYSDQLLFNTGDTTRQESSQAHVKEKACLSSVINALRAETWQMRCVASVGQGTLDVKHIQVEKQVWSCVRTPQMAVGRGHRHMQDVLTIR